MENLDNENGYYKTKEISTVAEVDEEDYNYDDESCYTRDLDDIALHEQVLIDYFGKVGADSYLHPAFDKSDGVVGMTANLQQISGQRNVKKGANAKRSRDEVITFDKLRNNAVRLWEKLRDSSNVDILKVDDKIPSDLKQTFNSFARSEINRNMTPQQRGFVEDSEIQQMTHKMRLKKDHGGESRQELDARKKMLMMNLSKVQENTQNSLIQDKGLLRNESVLEGSFNELYLPPLVPKSKSFDEPSNSKEYISSRDIIRNLEIRLEKENELFQRKNSPYNWNLRFFTEFDSNNILQQESNFYRHNTSLQPELAHQVDENESASSIKNDEIMTKIVNQTERWKKNDHNSTIQQQRHISEMEERMKVSSGQHEKRQRGYNSRTNSRDVAQGNTVNNMKKPLTLGTVMDFMLTRGSTFATEENNGGFRQGAAKLWRPKLTQV